MKSQGWRLEELFQFAILRTIEKCERWMPKKKRWSSNKFCNFIILASGGERDERTHTQNFQQFAPHLPDKTMSMMLKFFAKFVEGKFDNRRESVNGCVGNDGMLYERLKRLARKWNRNKFTFIKSHWDDGFSDHRLSARFVIETSVPSLNALVVRRLRPFINV